MDAKATITNSITLIGRKAIQKLEYDERTAEISVFFYEDAIWMSSDKKYLYLSDLEVPCSKFNLTRADIEAAIAATGEEG